MGKKIATIDLFHHDAASLADEQARCLAVRLQRRADAPLKPSKPQRQCDIGLFSDDAGQTDLVEMCRADAENAVVTPYIKRGEVEQAKSAEQSLTEWYHEAEERHTERQLQAIRSAPRHPRKPPFKPDLTPRRYRVMVDDNFHFMDESERTTSGEFGTLETAIAECRRIVDLSLDDLFKPGMTAEELYESYTHFGEDPFVLVPPGEPRTPFSAWDYAKQRASEMCVPRRP